MTFAISSDPDRLPGAADPDRAARGFERFREVADKSDQADLGQFAARLCDDPAGHALLGALFGNSPFLTQCLVREIEIAPVLFGEGADAALAQTLDDLDAVSPDESTARVGAALRKAKRRIALVTAVADIDGAWPLEDVTGHLSAFCERALSLAVSHLLLKAHQDGAITLPDPENPERGSGYIVLGMGKLGAHELNYSSDIDLIVLYDDEVSHVRDPDTIQQFFVRITRALVKLMDERTGEGYVFRTDLRLRPDPGATPVALSVYAAETYYESLGQNWERAAMIKARPVAGDREAGDRFLQALRPYVWRRHLDFAAIEDIQSIKRQIHAHKGGSTVAVAGHNVKLGRGGIREVEFFAQTQQLIWGGRDPSVRTPRTIEAIGALVAANRVAPEVAEDMIAGYRYLRRLEHRLQMADDQQTHSLPKDDAGLEAVATFVGYANREAFESDLLHHLRTIESHYAELFEESPSLGGEGALVFTGGEDHPDTLATLEDMGFSDTSMVAATVRGWHHGRYRATSSNRAREILTELMPALLRALGETANPDSAFRRFDDLLSGLPAGVQLFSLFQANPSLLSLVAEICGGSPRLAEWLGRNPLLLDGVLDPTFFEGLPDAGQMASDIEGKLAQARDMQDVLDISRRWANDAKFQVGVQILRHATDIDRAGLAFSDIADTAIRALAPRVVAEFAEQHGRCAGEGLAVLALGKLGGRELSATSDLDLVFLYDAPEGADMSDGPKPLSPSHYHQRLGQRLVNALTALTGEGRLYEVDMRLRPSGNAGPLAVSLPAFARYQAESAWTWEHLALTRARVVTASDAFADRIDAAIAEALTAERPADELLLAVADMRERMAKQHRTENIWSVKHLRGGLVDCEFICQYLLLRHAHDHPGILDPGTITGFRNLSEAGLLPPQVADDLIEACRLWRRLQGLLRLTVEGDADPERFPAPLRDQLTEAGECETFAALEERIRMVAERTRAHYEELIDQPAAALRERRDASKESQ